MNKDSHLTPEQRKKIIEMYEKQMEKIRIRLNELRDHCYPHAWQLEANKVWAKCAGCGTSRMWYPEMELHETQLPTITKAPHALPR